MSQQEFLEATQHYAEVSRYEAQEPVVEPIREYREYAAWEQNNEFVNRHLHGEKVQPQPDPKSIAWSLIPLMVLLFLIGGGAFGLTAAFHSAYPVHSSWDDDNFAPRHEWHRHFHCQVISGPDLDQQMIPGGPGVHFEQGDTPQHIIITRRNFCMRSDD